MYHIRVNSVFWTRRSPDIRHYKMNIVNAVTCMARVFLLVRQHIFSLQIIPLCYFCKVLKCTN